MKSFKAWVERVKSTVPPEKLLVFDVKEGWEPLCKFLNKPVPNEPFPNINDKKRPSTEDGAIPDLLLFPSLPAGCGHPWRCWACVLARASLHGLGAHRLENGVEPAE